MLKLKNLSIVQEIVLILSLPILILTLLLVQNVWENAAKKHDMSSIKHLLELCSDLASLSESVQNERLKSSLFLIGAGSSISEIQTTCRETDELLKKIKVDFEYFKQDFPVYIERASELFSPIEQNIGQLASIRMGTENKSITAAQVIEFYGNFNAAVVNNMTSFPRWIEKGNVMRRMTSLGHLSAAIEMEGILRAKLVYILDKKQMNQRDLQIIVNSIAESAVHLDVFHDLSVPNMQQQYLEKIKSPAYQQSTEIIEKLILQPINQDLVDVPSTAEWREKQTQKMNVLKDLRKVVNEEAYLFMEKTYQQAQSGFLFNIALLVVILMSIAALVFVMTKKLKNRFQILEDGLGKIADGDLTQAIALEGDSELGRLATFINKKLMFNLSDINLQIQKIVGTLKMVVQELSVSSKETLTTSNQQSAGVKEVVSTMEDTGQLSRQIAQKIDEVTKAVHQSEGEIQKGFNIIQQNQSKMGEIKEGTNQTIDGIKELGQQINSIWDIVNMINGIADQTKIIAFNAELEASSAGEAGKNFQIVATEIRRLADNTVNSTSEIKAKIHEIQKASDHLIVTSEAGSEKIQEGWQLSQSLQDVFNQILQGSEVTVKSSEIVSQSVQQQVKAFEQIVLTMKQLAEGINNFSIAVGGSTKMSENLKDISIALDKILQQYKLPQQTKNK
ncbi:MAG: methyl-accepting chemotaxis sensory transducer [Chlamydiales bacterium]|jgi:methyl-accepting chemotaxis protein|nr:methyl-accepting chemotaxis sensory transducer [Chlamydiales bacterium]